MRFVNSGGLLFEQKLALKDRAINSILGYSLAGGWAQSNPTMDRYSQDIRYNENSLSLFWLA